MFSGLANLLFGSSTVNPESLSEANENPATDVPTTVTTSNHQEESKSICDNFKELSSETEDDWILIGKDDEEDSLPRTDSEEELPFVDIKKNSTPHQRASTSTAVARYQGRNQRHQQRLANSSSPPLPVSPHCDGLNQSLYVVLPSSDVGHNTSFNPPASMSMEESWFLTPPPCFTSRGPINLELSPFENLLIEHPSMSVYHSIRSAQEATESFVNLDLGVETESQTARRHPNAENNSVSVLPPDSRRSIQSKWRYAHRRQARANRNKEQQPQAAPVVQHNARIHVESLVNAQNKQEVLLRNSQKIYDKKEQQNYCRGAMKRNNKVRDFNSKANRPRRADLQHCKLISGANNNRKC